MWDSGLEFRALGLEAFDFGSGLVRFRVLCVSSTSSALLFTLPSRQPKCHDNAPTMLRRS